MLAAAIDFLLYTHGWLSPVVSILWSLIAFGGWIFVLVSSSRPKASPILQGLTKLEPAKATSSKTGLLRHNHTYQRYLLTFYLLLLQVAWGVTEWSPDTGGFLDLYYYSYGTQQHLYGSGLFYGRIVTGSIAAALTLVQMSFASRAIDLERKQRQAKAVKIESARDLMQAMMDKNVHNDK